MSERAIAIPTERAKRTNWATEREHSETNRENEMNELVRLTEGRE